MSTKIGLVLLILGAMHFFNMYVIARFGHKAGSWQGGERKHASSA